MKLICARCTHLAQFDLSDRILLIMDRNYPSIPNDGGASASQPRVCYTNCSVAILWKLHGIMLKGMKASTVKLSIISTSLRTGMSQMPLILQIGTCLNLLTCAGSVRVQLDTGLTHGTVLVTRHYMMNSLLSSK